ncbi:hypothetical protein HNQ80_001178 [Anaerosolibacter carboniphilus]|uniref:Uncharacterized protein n=1 Tax=Anaerosolibacter carboniphilus TaxID=1417629 RepID=A0A841KY59_9FIRM|nr:hypothetical protein [Anaerosolibacter carboniphilus]MBB6215089.1 hypothetical protein [Anaerosolibacter carboniphilus]
MSIIHVIEIPEIFIDNPIELLNELIHNACIIITDERYKYKHRLKKIEWVTAALLNKYCRDNKISINKLIKETDLEIYYNLLRDFRKKDSDSLFFARSAITAYKIHGYIVEDTNGESN